MSNQISVINSKMYVRCIRCFAVLTVSCLLLTAGPLGCSGLFQQAAPEKALFEIDPGVPVFMEGHTITPTTQSVLQVRPVTLFPPYDGTAFVYRTGPSEFELDYYNNFVGAPSGLMTASLAEWLGKERVFSLVETNLAVRSNLILECDISKLLIDFSDPHKPRGVIAAHFLLYSGQANQTKVLADNYYEANSLVASNTPSGYVAAWGHAYRELLTEEMNSICRVITATRLSAPAS
jgi:hypothetical protein